MRTRRLTPYGFLLPTLLFLGVVFGYAVVAVVLESFRVPGLLGVTSWGATNYHDVVHDSLFWQSLLDNLKLFLAIPVMTIVGLLMAVLLHERAKGWRIYRSLAFLPYVLAVPVVGVVFSYILERNGVLNDMLNTLHLHFLVHDWLGNPSLALWSIALIIAWQQTGLAIVLFLARLASVDESLYEAAMVELRKLAQAALAHHAAAASEGDRVLRGDQLHQHAQLGVQLCLRDDGRRAAAEDLRDGALHLRGRLSQRPEQPCLGGERDLVARGDHRAVLAGDRT